MQSSSRNQPFKLVLAGASPATDTICPRSSVRFRAPPCEGGGRRCNSCRGHQFAPVPQQPQERFRKPLFVGASPTGGSKFIQGRDVIVSISACDADRAGANPAALTIFNLDGPQVIGYHPPKTGGRSVLGVSSSTLGSIPSMECLR